MSDRSKLLSDVVEAAGEMELPEETMLWMERADDVLGWHTRGLQALRAAQQAGEARVSADVDVLMAVTQHHAEAVGKLHDLVLAWWCREMDARERELTARERVLDVSRQKLEMLKRAHAAEAKLRRLGYSSEADS